MTHELNNEYFTSVIHEGYRAVFEVCNSTPPPVRFNTAVTSIVFQHYQKHLKTPCVHDIYIKVLSSVLANITPYINTVLEYDHVEHPSKSIRIFAFQNCFYYNFLIPLAEARIIC